MFYACYEASQFGIPEILPELLLLGVLREDRKHVLPWLGESADLDAIRRRIEQEIPHGEKIQTTVELPLSNAGKRVLAYAEEEVGRLKQQYLDTIHIVAGLARRR
jgi:ATP-dependent Clp protease ATP-binding subunit ClpA